MTEPSSDLTWFDALVLGIIQGLTEFFPVSSDGHLVIGRLLLDYQKNLLTLDVFLHLGTFLALLFVFHREAKQILTQTIALGEAVLKSRNLKLLISSNENRWVTYIWIVTGITGVMGLLVEKFIKNTYEQLWITGAGLLVTSLFLFCGSFAKKSQRSPESLSLWFPILLGLAQSSALLPGLSRSGSTISTCLLFGVARHKAGEFSFIASIPIIFLAILFEARKLTSIPPADWPWIFLGVTVSFIVGVLAIKGLLAMLRNLSLLPFAVYTFALSLLVFYWS